MGGGRRTWMSLMSEFCSSVVTCRGRESRRYGEGVRRGTNQGRVCEATHQCDFKMFYVLGGGNGTLRSMRKRMRAVCIATRSCVMTCEKETLNDDLMI